MPSQALIWIIVAAVVVIAAVVCLIVWNSKKSRTQKSQSEESQSEKVQSEKPRAEKSQSKESQSKESPAPQPSGAQQIASQDAAAAGAAASAEPAIGSSAETSAEEPAKVAESAESSESQESQTSQEPAATAAVLAESPEGKESRLTRLRSRLSKSANPFGKALFNILTKDNLSEADWEDIEDTLILADVGAETSAQIVDDLRADARVHSNKDASEVRATLRRMLLEQVGEDADRSLAAERADAHKPSVIIMVGVNGTGKTTTAGKLARLFVAEGKSVVLGAADTFRAAAADQLETWGSHVGVPVVRADHDGADPASVAFDAAQKAVDSQADVLIIDTAGRLQNKANLMDELGKIRRVVEKKLPVDEVLLVLDATTGQNGMVQARVFSEAIGVTGVALTKLDGSAKGGIVICVQKELGVPVKLVGLGEGPDDLAPFDPAGFVDGILGD
ncbi:signal recognition particle-docking protein FtsY [Pseudoscardovia suis]|uniref:signal recognition particle-docking protein FtsY n=1 Tax=Pseudoscardovia suis TaxID=987063 RepID=UPI003F98B0AF